MFGYEEEWITIALQPEYEISNWGRVRNKETGWLLSPVYSRRHRAWVYEIKDKYYKVSLLVYHYFPNTKIAINKEWRDKLEELDDDCELPKPTRRCHDCGKPTFDYRCEECWRKIRSQDTDYLFDPDIDRF